MSYSHLSFTLSPRVTNPTFLPLSRPTLNVHDIRCPLQYVMLNVMLNDRREDASALLRSEVCCTKAV